MNNEELKVVAGLLVLMLLFFVMKYVLISEELRNIQTRGGRRIGFRTV